MKANTTNPLIFNNPRDTLDHAASVLQFLQTAMPSDEIVADSENFFIGQGLVLHVVHQAITHASAALAPAESRPAKARKGAKADNVVQISG